jgi:hypothetical protein
VRLLPTATWGSSRSVLAKTRRIVALQRVRLSQVRFGSIFAVSMCSKMGLQIYLLEHLVDLDKQFSRNGNAEFLCGFLIDGELEILGKFNC